MATPFPTTGTMEGDVKAGLISGGVYNPNIDVSKITPTSPLDLGDQPPQDNYAAILAGLKTTLPEETRYKETEDKIIEKTKELGGEEAFQANKEAELGLDVNKKELTDLISQLRTVNTEAEVDKLELDRQGTPTRLTSANTLDRQNIERDRTIKALRLSSSIQAIQGNIELANDQVTRAVNLKYKPLKNELEVLNKQLDFNYKSFTAAEKKRADSLKQANDIKIKELDDAQKKEEDWVKTKNEALADGVPLSIVNTAQQFFDSKQETTARSLLGSYEKPKAPKAASTEPLSILDIGRYNEAYPDAGIVPGDTEAQANAKVRALSEPKEFTDDEFRKISIESKDTEKKTYAETIKEIEENQFIKNKDRAKQIAGEVYGREEQRKTVREESLEKQIVELKKSKVLKDSDVRYALKKRGFTSEEINKSSIGSFGSSFIDSISNFLYK